MSSNKHIKVCFFTKYPPIEGGVSTQAYWASRALGKRGVEVHVVTNALEVEEEFREKINFDDSKNKKEYQPKNVFVHNLNLDSAAHIPFSPAYLERLINLGLRVIKEYDCDLIDSCYIQPYGLAAVFTKILTGKPCILRHAGSDLFRLFPNKEFHTLYKTIFQIADIIVTGQRQKNLFETHGITQDQLWFNSFGRVDPEYFNPKVKPANLVKFGVPRKLLKKPILTYMGKCGHWKSLFDLVKVASSIKEDFLLLFLTEGLKFEEFKAYLKRFPSLKNKHYFLGFLPPWEIPSIIRVSTCLFQLESDFPIKAHMPGQPLEAFAVATPVLISDEIFSKYKIISPLLEKDRNVLTVNPQNHKDFKNILLRIIKRPGQLGEIGKLGYQEIFVEKRLFFNESIEKQISLYRQMVL